MPCARQPPHAAQAPHSAAPASSSSASSSSGPRVRLAARLVRPALAAGGAHEGWLRVLPGPDRRSDQPGPPGPPAPAGRLLGRRYCLLDTQTQWLAVFDSSF